MTGIGWIPPYKRALRLNWTFPSDLCLASFHPAFSGGWSPRCFGWLLRPGSSRALVTRPFGCPVLFCPMGEEDDRMSFPRLSLPRRRDRERPMTKWFLTYEFLLQSERSSDGCRPPQGPHLDCCHGSTRLRRRLNRPPKRVGAWVRL